MSSLAFVLLLTPAFAAVQQSVLCASYLDHRERAGGLVLPVVARNFVDDVVEKLTARLELGRAAPPWRRVGAYVRSRRGNERLVVDDVAVPPVDALEFYHRRRVAAGLGDLRELILTSSDATTPIRRLTRGRAHITEFLAGIKAQAFADQAALEASYDLRMSDLAAERTATRGARADALAKLRAKIAREGAESWRARYFGPSSELSVTQRLAVLTGYAKKVFGVSLLSGLVSPALIPVTAVTLGAGWWGVRQWLYLATDHAKVFVSGFLRERRVTTAMSRLEKFRAGVARADHQIADVDALITLVNRTDVPRAVAAFTYDVHLAMDPRAPEFTEALNGPIVRRAVAAAPARGLRIVRLHHVLSFGADGEPVLATNLIERTDLPAGARAWAATLVMSLFGG